jgi:hypothetical protein
MTTALLIIHGLLAVTLLGAITHQAVSVTWPRRDKSASFVASFRGVNGMTYTNAIVVLFLATAILGSIIYPAYRINVRTVLQVYRMHVPEGAFEVKENFVAIGAALLPAYWYFWRRSTKVGVGGSTRMALTVILAVIVWWAFLVGHIINNIRGFGS